MSIISPAPVTGTLPAVSPLSYPFAYVSTPPLPGSPFELPPMLERIKQLPHPPSPTSPHLMSVSSDEGYYHPASSCGRPLPAFLEPVPLLGLCSYESSFRPDFFPALKERHRHSLPSSLPLSLVHPPSPLKRDRRATIPGILQSNSLQHVRKLSFPHKIPAFQMSGSRRSMHTLPILPRPDPSSSEKEHGAQMTSPISPTMAAATATATATCALGTHTALQPQVKTPAASDTEMDTLDLRDHRQKPQTAFDRVSFTIHSMSKPQMGLDQSMFLTKNAHIKRPRNAWIHFRCHYGQALKTEDPTLRAEEISKRASRRWARLTEKEKTPWHDLAEQEKQAHKEAFPEYRYCPKRANNSVVLNCPPHTSSPMVSSRISPVIPMPRVYTSFSLSLPESLKSGEMHKKAKRRTK